MPGPIPKGSGFEPLMDAEKMTEILYRTQRYTDEAFDELVDDVGYRAARLVLRAKAVKGDIKALDLYIRLAKESKRERQALKDRVQVRDVTPNAFTSKDRTTTSSA